MYFSETHFYHIVWYNFLNKYCYLYYTLSFFFFTCFRFLHISYFFMFAIKVTLNFNMKYVFDRPHYHGVFWSLLGEARCYLLVFWWLCRAWSVDLICYRGKGISYIPWRYICCFTIQRSDASILNLPNI